MIVRSSSIPWNITSIFPDLLVKSHDIPILFPTKSHEILIIIVFPFELPKKNIELPATSRFSGDPQTKSAPAAAFPDKDHPGSAVALVALRPTELGILVTATRMDR